MGVTCLKQPLLWGDPILHLAFFLEDIAAETFQMIMGAHLARDRSTPTFRSHL